MLQTVPPGQLKHCIWQAWQEQALDGLTQYARPRVQVSARAVPVGTTRLRSPSPIRSMSRNIVDPFGSLDPDSMPTKTGTNLEETLSRRRGSRTGKGHPEQSG